MQDAYEHRDHDLVVNPQAIARPRADFAGAMAGLLAGCVYIASHALLSPEVNGGSMERLLLDTAAILLGPDAAAPRAQLHSTAVGMAMLVHFGLSALVGHFLVRLVRGRGMARSLLIGAGMGALLYILNLVVIAPVAFPWFSEMRGVAAFCQHVVFGLAAAGGCTFLLSGRREGPRETL